MAYRQIKSQVFAVALNKHTENNNNQTNCKLVRDRRITGWHAEVIYATVTTFN